MREWANGSIAGGGGGEEEALPYPPFEKLWADTRVCHLFMVRNRAVTVRTIIALDQSCKYFRIKRERDDVESLTEEELNQLQKIDECLMDFNGVLELIRQTQTYSFLFNDPNLPFRSFREDIPDWDIRYVYSNYGHESAYHNSDSGRK